MKHAHLSKQKYRHPAPGAFLDLRTQLNEQGLDIPPLDVRTRRPRKNQVDKSLMLQLHAIDGTNFGYC